MNYRRSTFGSVNGSKACSGALDWRGVGVPIVTCHFKEIPMSPVNVCAIFMSILELKHAMIVRNALCHVVIVSLLSQGSMLHVDFKIW